MVYNCNICQKKLTLEIEYNQHVNSKKHKKTLKRTIFNEIKEAGSLKSFLIKKGFMTKHRHILNKVKYVLYKRSMKKLLDS